MNKRYYIYDIIEKLNQYADDSEISPEHISFLIDETRNLILKQKFNKTNRIIPEALFQRIDVTLVPINDNEFMSYPLDMTVTSVEVIPVLIQGPIFNESIRIDGGSYTDIKFQWTNLERFPYIGYNKLLTDIVYVTLGYDYKFKLKGRHNRYKLLERLRVNAIFQYPDLAWQLHPDYDSAVDVWDLEYPIDVDMWVMMSDIIMKQLLKKLQIPEDKINDAATES
jgi:hypothetical protein